MFHDVCSRCKKKPEHKLGKCSSCKQAQYCGVGCQVTDWPTHRQSCNMIAGKAHNSLPPTPVPEDSLSYVVTLM